MFAFSKHRTSKSKRKKIHCNLSAGCRVHGIRRGDLTYIREWGVLDGDFRRKILESGWIKTFKKTRWTSVFGHWMCVDVFLLHRNCFEVVFISSGRSNYWKASEINNIQRLQRPFSRWIDALNAHAFLQCLDGHKSQDVTSHSQDAHTESVGRDICFTQDCSKATSSCVGCP